MKKLFLILGILLLSADALAGNNIDNQKFVNPIFYQPLEPLSKHTGYVYLTPTSTKFMTPLNKELVDATGQCELIENEENFVKLSCKVKWRKIKGSTMVVNSDNYFSLWLCTYEIKGMFSDTCLKVERVIYEVTKEGNEKLSTSYYCISPSVSPSESD